MAQDSQRQAPVESELDSGYAKAKVTCRRCGDYAELLTDVCEKCTQIREREKLAETQQRVNKSLAKLALRLPLFIIWDFCQLGLKAVLFQYPWLLLMISSILIFWTIHTFFLLSLDSLFLNRNGGGANTLKIRILCFSLFAIVLCLSPVLPFTFLFEYFYFSIGYLLSVFAFLLIRSFGRYNKNRVASHET